MQAVGCKTRHATKELAAPQITYNAQEALTTIRARWFNYLDSLQVDFGFMIHTSTRVPHTGGKGETSDPQAV